MPTEFRILTPNNALISLYAKHDLIIANSLCKNDFTQEKCFSAFPKEICSAIFISTMMLQCPRPYTVIYKIRASVRECTCQCGCPALEIRKT